MHRALILLLLSVQAHAFSVDLHAHLFMYEGTGYGYTPAPATTWSQKLRLRTSPEALDVSGVKLVVVALYANPFFWYSQRESIRAQIRATHDFVLKHPQWVLVRSAREARQALAAGKRAMVLSIEGASGILTDERFITEFVDKEGVAMVTLTHFTDDEFGGAAFYPQTLQAALTNPWAWYKSILFPAQTEGPENAKANPAKLTERGWWLVRELVKRGVWIDLAHASDGMSRELLPWLAEKKLPLLYTHTVLQRYYGSDRGISLGQALLARSQGVALGVIPSEDMLIGTQLPEGLCSAFMVQFLELQALLTSPGAHKDNSVQLGSDINSPMTMLRRSCVEGPGYYQYGQLRELFADLQKSGAKLNDPMQMLEGFLRTWERVRPGAKP